MKTDYRKGWAKSSATNILRVAVVLLFLGLAVWAITLNRYDLVIAGREPWLWLTVALVSVGPELAGIVIGVVTIDYLNERRQREQLKAQLIRQLGMNIRDVAVPAARELAHHGWLYDGSLSGIDLTGANLGGAYLNWADLTQASLRWAHLADASLILAKLSEADLTGADLEGAQLSEALLSRCDLSRANLARATLFGAVLTGANLGEANLNEADLSEANLFGVVDWTPEQLKQAALLTAVTMPNGIKINGYLNQGLTFEEWEMQYLAERTRTEG